MTYYVRYWRYEHHKGYGDYKNNVTPKNVYIIAVATATVLSVKKKQICKIRTRTQPAKRPTF